MPPRDPKPANSRRKSKPKLDIPETELTAMLEQYCDLRRRGFGQQAIQTKASWPRHYPSLLLEEAQRREMSSSQRSQEQAVTEWLLAMYDAGTELRVIQRMSAFTGLQIKNRLKAALDAASGPAPTGLIIRNPDGEPARVSWLDTNGNLIHRPFDGAFPPDYPAALAVRQCTEILYRLLGYPNNSARDRAYTMLSMALAGLHSFDYDTGKWVHAELDRAGLDEDAKRTFILKLHPHPSVGQLSRVNYFCRLRQLVLPVHLLGLAALLGRAGAVAGHVKLQDDGVMHHPVNRRGGGHGVGEDALPLREDQVGRDAQRPPLVAFGDEGEEHLRLLSPLGQVAQVIEEQEVEVVQPAQLPGQGQVALGGEEFLHQAVGGSE